MCDSSPRSLSLCTKTFSDNVRSDDLWRSCQTVICSCFDMYKTTTLSFLVFLVGGSCPPTCSLFAYLPACPTAIGCWISLSSKPSRSRKSNFPPYDYCAAWPGRQPTNHFSSYYCSALDFRAIMSVIYCNKTIIIMI